MKAQSDRKVACLPTFWISGYCDLAAYSVSGCSDREMTVTVVRVMVTMEGKRPALFLGTLSQRRRAKHLSFILEFNPHKSTQMEGKRITHKLGNWTHADSHQVSLSPRPI